MVMLKKIGVFVWDVLLALVIGAVSIAFNLPFSTSLELHCELEPDNTYTCLVRETVLNYTLSESQYKNVISTFRDLNCSGSGSKRGCSANGEFHTSTGEKLVFTRSYTDSTRVQQLVNEVDGAMAAGTTPIDFSGKRYPIIGICLAAFMTPLFLLVAILKIFPRPKDGKPVTLIRWKRE
jgi:hypothetical protein